MFVPGLACRRDIFERAQTYLPDIDPVVLEWPWPEELETIDDAASWLSEQIEAHEARGLVGHSLGGFVAMHLFGHLGHQPSIPLIIADTFMVDPHPFFRNHLWDPDAALQGRVVEMLEAERPRFPRLRAAAMGHVETDAWREAAVGTGAGFIYGGRGGDYSAAEIARLAGLPAGATNPVRVIDRTSHFLMLEAPAAFYGAVADLMSAPR